MILIYQHSNNFIFICTLFLIRLTDIEGFRLLCRLEYLDVSDNALDTFDGNQ